MATRKKLSNFTTYDFSNIDPSTYLVGVVANNQNLNINSQSLYNTFDKKGAAASAETAAISAANSLMRTEVKSVSSYLQDEIDNITGGGGGSGDNGIVWITSSDNPYINARDALLNNKLPVYSASPFILNPIYAYFKDMSSDGIRFCTLADCNTTFTEYLVKSDNSVSATEVHMAKDSMAVFTAGESNLFTKVQNAVGASQDVTVLSSVGAKQRNRLNLTINIGSDTYYFNMVKNDGTNNIFKLTSTGWEKVT